jgi:hypothetical protein
MSHDTGGVPTQVRLSPTFGYGLHARWDMHRYLRFTAYFVDVRHPLSLPEGSLGQATIAAGDVYTYVFGAQLALQMPLNKRTRMWLGSGIGWGQIVYTRMIVNNPPDYTPFMVRERHDSYAEIPFALGTSFDIVPNWLSFELQVSASYITGQGGEASDGPIQAIDAAGRIRPIGPLPKLDTSIVQSMGLSLIL